MMCEHKSVCVYNRDGLESEPKVNKPNAMKPNVKKKKNKEKSGTKKLKNWRIEKQTAMENWRT